VIELNDDRSTRANFISAFGTLTDEASRLHFEGRYRLWIAPPLNRSTVGRQADPPGAIGARFELRNGQVSRVE